MKKILLTVFAACLVFAASAQFKGGLKAGANLANLSGDVTNNEMLFAFHVGAYGNFSFSDKFSLQPELLYYGAGCNFDPDGDIKLSYLAVPVMFIYNVSEQFNLQAGPQLGLLLSAESDGEDIKEFLSGTDFGLNLGVGANFGKFNAAARYSLGFSNIIDDGSDLEAKNNVIQISVGYTLFGGD